MLFSIWRRVSYGLLATSTVWVPNDSSSNLVSSYWSLVHMLESFPLIAFWLSIGNCMRRAAQGCLFGVCRVGMDPCSIRIDLKDRTSECHLCWGCKMGESRNFPADWDEGHQWWTEPCNFPMDTTSFPTDTVSFPIRMDAHLVAKNPLYARESILQNRVVGQGKVQSGTSRFWHFE